jgi:hypothetical protein
MTDKTNRLAWEPPFLAALGELKNVKRAAHAAGIASGSVYARRKKSPAFAREWDAALAGKLEQVETVAEAPRPVHWRKTFMEALAEMSNVKVAAARANVSTRAVYKLRREDPDFAAKWLAALNEGYDNLEMEVVGYLRDPQPSRKMDVTAALRLLAAHRETVERRRALAEEEDEQAVLDSIDAFLEGMRQRRIANEALLREPKNDNDAG